MELISTIGQAYFTETSKNVALRSVKIAGIEDIMYVEDATKGGYQKGATLNVIKDAYGRAYQVRLTYQTADADKLRTALEAPEFELEISFFEVGGEPTAAANAEVKFGKISKYVGSNLEYEVDALGNVNLTLVAAMDKAAFTAKAGTKEIKV